MYIQYPLSRTQLNRTIAEQSTAFLECRLLPNIEVIFQVSVVVTSDHTTAFHTPFHSAPTRFQVEQTWGYQREVASLGFPSREERTAFTRSTFGLINACPPGTQSSFLSALPCSSPDILDALASSFLNQRYSRIFPSFPPKQATNTCLAGFRGTRSKYQEGKGSVTRQSEDLEAAALLSCRKVPCHTMSCYSSQLRPERCLKKEHWKGRVYKAGGKGRATAMCV